MFIFGFRISAPQTNVKSLEILQDKRNVPFAVAVMKYVIRDKSGSASRLILFHITTR